MFNEKVYHFVYIVRILRSRSQEETAAKLGYSKIERGETDLNFAKLERIARLLEVDFDELAGMKEGRAV